MLFIKILFTLLFVLLSIAVSSSLLADSDDKRNDLWNYISQISWAILLIIVIVGSITYVWMI